MRQIIVAMSTVIVLLSQTITAHGQVAHEKGILGWFELNTFHATSNPNDGFFLERAQVLKALQPAAGALFQIDDDPLTWQKNDDGEYNQTATEVEHQMVLHLNAALGVFHYGQLGAQFPLYLDRGTGQTRSGGVGDIRFIPKVGGRFDVGENADMGIAVLVPITFPSGDKKEFTGQGKMTYEPRLAVDTILGRVRLVFNGGMLFFDGQSGYGLKRGNELILGIGADFNLYEDSDCFKLIAEVQMSTQTADMFGRASTPADMLVGLNYRFDNGFALMGGMGTGLSPSAGSPDFRMVAGFGYVPPFEDPEEATKEEQVAEPTIREALGQQDSDGDGVFDMNDFCPDEAEDFDNFDDDDGCLEEDNDEDGIPDLEDECPMASETFNQIDDEDGCPEDDNDDDKIPNERDKCPDEAEDMDNFQDADGCPELDNDGDGVPDDKDKCPLIPESKRAKEVKDGCLDSFTIEDGKVVFEKPVQFVKRRADLSASGMDAMEDLAALLNASPDITEVRISVHSSGRGNKKRNQKRTEDRAMTTIRTLVGLDVDPERLVAEGKGDSEQLESPKTKKGRTRNERVEVTLVKGGEK